VLVSESIAANLKTLMGEVNEGMVCLKECVKERFLSYAQDAVEYMRGLKDYEGLDPAMSTLEALVLHAVKEEVTRRCNRVFDTWVNDVIGAMADGYDVFTLTPVVTHILNSDLRGFVPPMSSLEPGAQNGQRGGGLQAPHERVQRPDGGRQTTRQASGRAALRRRRRAHREEEEQARAADLARQRGRVAQEHGGQHADALRHGFLGVLEPNQIYRESLRFSANPIVNLSMEAYMQLLARVCRCCGRSPRRSSSRIWPTPARENSSSPSWPACWATVAWTTTTHCQRPGPGSMRAPAHSR